MTDEAQVDQAVEQSAEEKIASKFGFPQQSEPPEEVQADSTQESDLFELEWEDGNKYQVPSKLKDGFMRNSDYTRKTQELAEQRKVVEHAREIATSAQLNGKFAESVAEEQKEISVIDAYLAQVKSMDWGSMSSEQLLRTKIELDNIKERRETLEKSVTDKRAKFMDEVKSKINELRGKSRELASKNIDGFGEETEKALRSFAVREGLTDPEVDNVLLDPRSYKIMWKAMQFDQVKANAKQAPDKAAKVLKPGPSDNRMPPETVAKLNFGKAMKSAKTSSEKARAIEDRLTGIFSRG